MGAVRHHGFLPWDDDVDIVLTKENWEKLQKALETDLPPNRALVGWDRYEEEPSTFFRYVDTTKTTIHLSLWDHQMPWGTIVDIFVLNPLPTDQKKWDNYHKTMRRFGEYLLSAPFLMNSRVSVSTYLLDCVKGKLMGSIPVKKELYKKLSRYDEATCTHFSYLYSRIHLVYPKEVFGEPRYVPFEGRMMPVPTLAEEHFRILFGDDWYMVPPDSGQIHHIAQHDMKRSYREYMFDYLRYTNLPKLKKSIFRVKLIKMVGSKVKRWYDSELARLRAKYLKEIFEAQFSADSERLEKLAAEGKYSSLFAYFDPFYQEQLLPVMLENKRAVTVPKRYLELALRVLVAAGCGRKAQKILDVQKKATKNQPFFAEIQQLIKKKNELFLAFETGKAEAAAIADELFAYCPYDKDVRYLKLVLDLKNEDKDICFDKLLSEAEIGQAQWPGASEFEKCRADELLRQGKTDEAAKIYKHIVNTTHNGMLIQEIKENPQIRQLVENLESRQLERLPENHDTEGKRAGGKSTDSQKILHLLLKVTRICEQSGIPYYLGFYPMRLVLTTGVIPEGVHSLEIFVPKEHMDKLASVLAADDDLVLEDQQINPDACDTILKVGDKNSVFFNILIPQTTQVPAYSIHVTAIAAAPLKTKKNKKNFLRNQYGQTKFNIWKNRPFCSFLRLFPYRRTNLPVQYDDGFVCLLRYKYRNISIPKAYFCDKTTLNLNGYDFCAVQMAEKFLRSYYKKPKLDSYALVAKVDENCFIDQPNLSLQKSIGKNTHIVRILSRIRLLAKKFIRADIIFMKDRRYINAQKRFFQRTIDRFAMADIYEPQRETWLSAYERGDWRALRVIFDEYLETTRKYFGWELPFAFDHECYDVLTDVLYHTTDMKDLLAKTSPDAKLFNWMKLKRKNALAYLDYVNRFHPN